MPRRRRPRFVDPRQLAFTFEFAPQLDVFALEFDEDEMPVHRRVSARACAAPRTTAATSIFDIGRLSALTGWRAAEDTTVHRLVMRDGDVTRHVSLREQDTDEWAERERARRARQKPPRPPKTAKTKSRKLLDLVGAN